MSNDRYSWRKLIPSAVIVALGIVCYARSFDNQWVWDDHSQIADNRFLRSWRFVPRYFTWEVFDANGPASNVLPIYRPLWLLSFMVQFQIGGPHPFCFHLVNLLLHVANALLVMALLRALATRGELAWLAAALFVAHPVHTESVTFMASQGTELVTLFLLAALLLLLKSCSTDPKPRTRWLVASVLAFALAMFTKESAVTFVGVVAAAAWLLPQASTLPRRIWLRVLGAEVFVMASYLIARHLALPAMTSPSSLSWIKKGGLVLRSLAAHVGLCVAPFNLHPERALPMDGWQATALAVVGAVIAVALAAVCVWFYRRDRRVVFGVALLAIAFSITSNAVALNITFAERWLYWPMVGLLIALTAALDFAINHRPHVRTPALAVGWIAVVVCGVLTISQNRIWHDEATLYEEVIARGGDTARVRANLAGYYLETGQIEKARAHLEKARQKNPDHAQVLRVMGMLLSAEGDFSAATNWFVRAQAVEPSNPAIPIWLATCQEQLGDLAAAEATLHTATLRSSGGLPELRLANFYYRHEKFEEAERALRDLLQRDPQSAAAHNTLGTVLFRKGDPSAARRHFLSALRYDRWLVDAHANLAALADAQGDLVQAKKYYRDALHLAPQNAELHYALAVLLAHHGQRGDAQRALEHALELDPHLESARQLLNTLNQQKAN